MKAEKNIVLENLQFDHGSGSLEFNGIRYMLVRPETIVEIQKVMEERAGPDAAHDILYKSGFRGTSLTAKKLLEKGLPPRQCLRDMFNMGTHLGWGKFEIINGESEGGVIEVTIHASPFAKAYGPSRQPVCSILCGALAGIFTTLSDKDYVCHEIICVAANDTSCLFRLEPQAEND